MEVLREKLIESASTAQQCRHEMAVMKVDIQTKLEEMSSEIYGSFIQVANKSAALEKQALALENDTREAKKVVYAKNSEIGKYFHECNSL